ncbi:MAG: (2Fe-2S)-binding protein [Chloroflexi bacterium]|nr:(2Fe-2S)-binding protein [Chloroflexota bacterium]
MKHHVQIEVNGRPRDDWVEERELLVTYLRETLGLTGTHVGCVVGECGACSVHLDGALVKSCLVLAVQAGGRSVRTVEGLGRGGELDAVQASFVDAYGVQCGYCTPGMLLAAHALLDRNPDPDEADVRRALAGNVCMCTGYVQIVRAVLDAARRMRAPAGSERR